MFSYRRVNIDWVCDCEDSIVIIVDVPGLGMTFAVKKRSERRCHVGDIQISNF